MTITATPYGPFVTGLGTGAFNLTTDTLMVMLVTASYSPNRDTNQYLTDGPSANEVVGTNYTAGGITLTTVAWTYDATNHWTTLTCDPVQWSSITATFRFAVLYKATGTSSTSPLIGYLDYGVNQAPSAENFVITFSPGAVRVRATAL